MSEPKYTPKHCSVYESSDGFFSVYESDETVFSDGPHHVVACDVHPGYSKLFAAAPEMAEMLLSMFLHVSHGGPTRAEAEALLKKAGVL